MRVLAAMLLMTTSALAQEPVMLAPIVPTEEMKVQALLEAYKANGNSMVGWNVWDGRVPVKTDKVPYAPPVKVLPATEKNTLDAIADMTDPEPVADICKRHGMRKVTHGDGWRCRK